MSTRTPNQEKALRWFCETNELRPALSVHPKYDFYDHDGKLQTHHITHIVKAWEEQREIDKKARKDEKRRTA